MLTDLVVFAQAALGGYSIVQVALLIVVVAAVCALVGLALKGMGIALPAFVVQALWIIAVAVVCILAIIFLSRIAGFS